VRAKNVGARYCAAGLDKAALKKNTVTSLLWIWMAVERTAG